MAVSITPDLQLVKVEGIKIVLGAEKEVKIIDKASFNRIWAGKEEQDVLKQGIVLNLEGIDAEIYLKDNTKVCL